MYTSWLEVPVEDRMDWAQWALENGQDTQTEEQRLAWINEREAKRLRPRRVFESAPLVSAKSEAARLRSRRFQIKKKLEEHFQIYEVFTVEEAARKTGLNPDILEGYLNYESQIGSSQVAKAPNGAFKLMTGFEVGVERDS